MLKVTTTDQDRTITLKLEGRLAGPWVQEVSRVWMDTAQCSWVGCVIDLRSVTFIDNPGRALLADMSRSGAQLIATDCLTRNIVDEIQREFRPQPGSTL
jgi:hypothetical protein